MANNVLKTVLDTSRRLAEVARWQERFKRIKAAGISRRQFCLKYGISQEPLCRYLNNQLIPEWPNIKKINAALTKAIRALPRK